MTTPTSAPPSFFTSAEPEDIYLKRMVTTPRKMVTSSWPHPYKEELNLCHTLTYMDLISMKTTNYKLHLFLNTTCKASFFSRCNSSRLHPLVNKQQVIRLKNVSFTWQNCVWLGIWRELPPFIGWILGHPHGKCFWEISWKVHFNALLATRE